MTGDCNEPLWVQRRKHLESLRPHDTLFFVPRRVPVREEHPDGGRGRLDGVLVWIRGPVQLRTELIEKLFVPGGTPSGSVAGGMVVVVLHDVVETALGLEAQDDGPAESPRLRARLSSPQ